MCQLRVYPLLCEGATEDEAALSMQCLDSLPLSFTVCFHLMPSFWGFWRGLWPGCFLAGGRERDQVTSWPYDIFHTPSTDLSTLDCAVTYCCQTTRGKTDPSPVLLKISYTHVAWFDQTHSLCVDSCLAILDCEMFPLQLALTLRKLCNHCSSQIAVMSAS